jgi:hypothetical protein
MLKWVLERFIFEVWPFCKAKRVRCLCDHLKSIVHATEFNDVAEQQQRVEEECELIRNTAGIFERVRQSIMRRTARCVEAQKQNF